MKKILIALTAVLLFSCGISKEPGTISVSGTGNVIISPDTAQLRISVSERAQTTKEAQNLSNSKLSEIISGVKSAGVEDKNIQTSALSFANDQVWNPDTRRNEIVGRIVSQTVSVKFENLNDSPDVLPSVLDELGNIDGIGIGNLEFSVDDPQPQFIEARRLAFKKAEQKAAELAGYAGIKLGRAVSISEENSGPVPLYSRGLMQSNEASMDYGTGTASEIPGGEISISYSINVIFETN